MRPCSPPKAVGASLTGLYLPREVFFGRLGFAGAFVPVCASDFGRFFPATSAPSGLCAPAETVASRGYPERELSSTSGRSSQCSSRARVTGFALPVLVEELLLRFRQNATAIQPVALPRKSLCLVAMAVQEADGAGRAWHGRHTKRVGIPRGAMERPSEHERHTNRKTLGSLRYGTRPCGEGTRSVARLAKVADSTSSTGYAFAPN
jgi:hypothetical protein